LANRGEPNRGNIYFKIQGRWDYGTTGPQNLGFVSLASQIGTANTFSAYTPAFILRNLYWDQGSKKAGWAYRVGKISTDATLATSRHISPVTTFLPNGGTGLFVSGYPDSGLGAVGVWFPSERYRILGLVSDSNGNRYDFGDITAGDFYTALEFGVQIAPRTEKAGYSKFTFWHSDGTKDGQPINASTGKEGYGMTVKLEHEFTDDGKKVGIIRWGKTWNKAALYDDQAAVHLLFYDPPGPAGLQHDLIGVAVNWAQASAAGARGEYNFETFYRFPFFTGLDTTLSYQYVYHPALTRMHKDMRSAGFARTQTLNFPQPVYPSGWWSATMAGDTDLSVFRQRDVETSPFETRYYNQRIHNGALALPNFVEKHLQENT
jgi:hypothetical protein